jgi:hypothetical protein
MARTEKDHVMQYMLLIHEDESVYAGEGGDVLMAEVLEKHMAFGAGLQEAGITFSGERLRPASAATTIRWDYGAASMHDGAFAETHEELGGFYIIDVPDLDSALAWARRLPIPGKGAIEVRPIWPMDDGN